MPRIAGCAVATPAGDLEAALAALASGDGEPGSLDGDLDRRLAGLARTAHAGRRADLAVIATTKGDMPRWCAALAMETYGGRPAWLAERVGDALGCSAFAVSAACASSPVALGVAARRIRAGRGGRGEHPPRPTRWGRRCSAPATTRATWRPAIPSPKARPRCSSRASRATRRRRWSGRSGGPPGVRD